MKLREIAERLAPLFNTAGIGLYSSEMERARSLLGVPLDKIAAALGVEVEPDEPELPERLAVRASSAAVNGAPDGFIHPATSAVNFGESSLLVGGPSVAFCERLVEELVAAYNGRPQWRHGDPPAADDYLVRFERRGVGGCNYAVAFWAMRPLGYTGWTTPTGGELSRKVIGWLPLPE